MASVSFAMVRALKHVKEWILFTQEILTVSVIAPSLKDRSRFWTIRLLDFNKFIQISHSVLAILGCIQIDWKCFQLFVKLRDSSTSRRRTPISATCPISAIWTLSAVDN